MWGITKEFKTTMYDKFKNKYRIPSARLQKWDYGWDGAYFITICTKNRECFFGEVVKEEMKYSHAGLIAEIMWYEIKNHAQNIKFGAYQIMPNHMHGILILEGNGDRGDLTGGRSKNPGRDKAYLVSKCDTITIIQTTPIAGTTQKTPTPNHRPTPFSKPRQKHHFVHLWRIQIVGNETLQPIGN